MADFASWLATGLTTVAALMTASNLGSRFTGYGFAVFFVGSLAWLTTGYLTDQPALIWTNAVLSILNLFGVWRWLGRQAKIEEGAEMAQARSEVTPGEALFPASLIARATLLDRNGAELGRGIDAMVGCRSGRIAYLVIAQGGVAGLGERHRRLDWGRVWADGQELRTGIGKPDFDQLPELAPDRWPG